MEVGPGDRVVSGVVVGVDLDWLQPAAAPASNKKRLETVRYLMNIAAFESTILRDLVCRTPPRARPGNTIITPRSTGKPTYC